MFSVADGTSLLPNRFPLPSKSHFGLAVGFAQRDVFAFAVHRDHVIAVEGAGADLAVGVVPGAGGRAGAGNAVPLSPSSSSRT